MCNLNNYLRNIVNYIDDVQITIYHNIVAIPNIVFQKLNKICTIIISTTRRYKNIPEYFNSKKKLSN